jgi:hypothetical protein
MDVRKIGYADGTGSASCSLAAGFGVSGTEPSDFATEVLVVDQYVRMNKDEYDVALTVLRMETY